MMKDALFAGVNAAVLTPMRADLSVDLDRMARTAAGCWRMAATTLASLAPPARRTASASTNALTCCRGW